MATTAQLQSGTLAARGRIRLLDFEPDLVRFLTAEDREQLEQFYLPVVDVSKRLVSVTSFLNQRRVFAAVVLDGMLLHYLQIGAQPGLRVIGPGEIVAPRDAPRSTLLADSLCHTGPSTKLALLGDDLLRAARRSPRILIGIQVRMAEQIERVATQLVICQLPRVADRLLAMLWLLAESWGRVTPSGTTLPLSLTHEVLGALVGARRPTVTLALGELADRGAVVQRDGGWLLLERPEKPPRTFPKFDQPELLDQSPSSWAAEVTVDWDAGRALASLSETVAHLREQHQRNVTRIRERELQMARSRERTAEVRQQIRERRMLTRQAPPSG